jgi:hypothetical protein
VAGREVRVECNHGPERVARGFRPPLQSEQEAADVMCDDMVGCAVAKTSTNAI